jgi:hypothetical protein
MNPTKEAKTANTKIEKRVSYLTAIALIHASLFYFATHNHVNSIQWLTTAIYVVTLLPWIVAWWLGLPVTAPVTIALFLPVIQPNALGISLCVVAWLVAYWFIAGFVARKVHF